MLGRHSSWNSAILVLDVSETWLTCSHRDGVSGAACVLVGELRPDAFDGEEPVDEALCGSLKISQDSMRISGHVPSPT